jgi:hypothetical protein
MTRLSTNDPITDPQPRRVRERRRAPVAEQQDHQRT